MATGPDVGPGGTWAGGGVGHIEGHVGQEPGGGGGHGGNDQGKDPAKCAQLSADMKNQFDLDNKADMAKVVADVAALPADLIGAAVPFLGTAKIVFDRARALASIPGTQAAIDARNALIGRINACVKAKSTNYNLVEIIYDKGMFTINIEAVEKHPRGGHHEPAWEETFIFPVYLRANGEFVPVPKPITSPFGVRGSGDHHR